MALQVASRTFTRNSTSTKKWTDVTASRLGHGEGFRRSGLSNVAVVMAGPTQRGCMSRGLVIIDSTSAVRFNKM